MNEHYALDPESLTSARDLQVLLRMFGLQTGRFVAKYPLHWPSLFTQYAKSLSDVERARMLALWRAKKSALLPIGELPYDVGMAWSNNAAVAHEKHRAFHEVIGRACNGFGWRAPDDVLYGDEGDLPDGRGDHVPMKAMEYAKCVAPLLHASAEVTLVDPYFTLEQEGGRPDMRRIPVLKALLQVANQSPSMQSLRLILERRHIERTMGATSRLQERLQQLVKESGVGRVAVSVKVVEKDEIGHGRYIFSIHGGLQFDQGFEEQKGARNHVHWLSEPELKPILDKFGVKTRL